MINVAMSVQSGDSSEEDELGHQSNAFYHLRPNKAIDRETFLRALVQLSSNQHTRPSSYYSLSSSRMVDIRQLYDSSQIDRYFAFETKTKIVGRMKVNRPHPSVSVEPQDINTLPDMVRDRVDSGDRGTFIWLDFTNHEYESFFRLIERIIEGVGPISVLKLTCEVSVSSFHNLRHTGSGKSRDPKVDHVIAEALIDRLGDYSRLADVNLVSDPPEFTNEVTAKTVGQVLNHVVVEISSAAGLVPLVLSQYAYTDTGPHLLSSTYLLVDPDDSLLITRGWDWCRVSTPYEGFEEQYSSFVNCVSKFNSSPDDVDRHRRIVAHAEPEALMIPDLSDVERFLVDHEDWFDSVPDSRLSLGDILSPKQRKQYAKFRAYYPRFGVLK